MEIPRRPADIYSAVCLSGQSRLYGVVRLWVAIMVALD